jgi:hypothetical protein
MNEMEEQTVQCPYCGEMLTVLVDCSVSHQQYIEDCEVCCRPIHFDVSLNDDRDLTVVVKNENE